MTRRGPNKKRRKRVQKDQDEDLNDKIFTVERIISKRFHKNRTEYLIKWKDWSDEHNTWEPRSNIFDFNLIETFEETQQLELKKSLFHDPDEPESASSCVETLSKSAVDSGTSPSPPLTSHSRLISPPTLDGDVQDNQMDMLTLDANNNSVECFPINDGSEDYPAEKPLSDSQHPNHSNAQKLEIKQMQSSKQQERSTEKAAEVKDNAGNAHIHPAVCGGNEKNEREKDEEEEEEEKRETVIIPHMSISKFRKTSSSSRSIIRAEEFDSGWSITEVDLEECPNSRIIIKEYSGGVSDLLLHDRKGRATDKSKTQTHTSSDEDICQRKVQETEGGLEMQLKHHTVAIKKRKLKRLQPEETSEEEKEEEKEDAETDRETERDRDGEQDLQIAADSTKLFNQTMKIFQSNSQNSVISSCRFLTDNQNGDCTTRNLPTKSLSSSPSTSVASVLSSSKLLTSSCSYFAGSYALSPSSMHLADNLNCSPNRPHNPFLFNSAPHPPQPEPPSTWQSVSSTFSFPLSSQCVTRVSAGVSSSAFSRLPDDSLSQKCISSSLTSSSFSPASTLSTSRSSAHHSTLSGDSLVCSPPLQLSHISPNLTSSFRSGDYPRLELQPANHCQAIQLARSNSGASNSDEPIDLSCPAASIADAISTTSTCSTFVSTSTSFRENEQPLFLSLSLIFAIIDLYQTNYKDL